MAICKKCKKAMRLNKIELDASGAGYTLMLSGIPVHCCDNCHTSPKLEESEGIGVDEIVSATMSALETLSASAWGQAPGVSFQCLKCRAKLPDVPDADRAYFKANAPMGSRKDILGVMYHGDSLTCGKCSKKHTTLPPALYHKIRAEIAESISHYLYT